MTGSCQYAGQGGNTTIAAFPQHHTVPIWSVYGHIDSAFVKFNAVNLPSSYDLVIAGDSGEDHVHIPNLKPGKYYIYMTGYDSLHGPFMEVFPYTLTQTSGELDLDVLFPNKKFQQRWCNESCCRADKKSASLNLKKIY